MIPIIFGAIAALGAAVAALAAREARCEAAERERVEAARRARRVQRVAAEEKDARAQRMGAAKQLIAQHGLNITPALLVNLASRGVGPVMLKLNSVQDSTSRNAQNRAIVVRLEREASEVKALIDMVKRRRYP